MRQRLVNPWVLRGLGTLLVVYGVVALVFWDDHPIGTPGVIVVGLAVALLGPRAQRSSARHAGAEANERGVDGEGGTT